MNKKYTEISVCEICQKPLEDKPVLNLGWHALCDDLVPLGDSRSCEEYPIEIYYCSNCRTAHQKFQVPKHQLFKSSYHYRARFTADVINGMREFVASCESRFGSLIGKKVLDIGCNDGSLLNFFRDKGAITLGVEPTEACEEALSSGHTAYKDFINEDLARLILNNQGSQDFITFTNVFAHIENISEVLSAIKLLMHDSTLLVVENHYLGAVLSGNQFDTFYHEHPRTYSYTSFVYIAKLLGIDVLDVEFPSRYGGNIRVFMGNKAIYGLNTQISEVNKRESKFGEQFTKLAKDVELWKIEKRQYLTDLFHKYGRLKAKAFPGRAAIIVKLLGLDESIFEAIYEKPGSLKIGSYVPGTKIPILSDDELDLQNFNGGPLINMAWHIPNEIRTYLDEIGYRGPVEDILNQNYFKN